MTGLESRKIEKSIEKKVAVSTDMIEVMKYL